MTLRVVSSLDPSGCNTHSAPMQCGCPADALQFPLSAHNKGCVSSDKIVTKSFFIRSTATRSRWAAQTQRHSYRVKPSRLPLTIQQPVLTWCDLIPKEIRHIFLMPNAKRCKCKNRIRPHPKNSNAKITSLPLFALFPPHILTVVYIAEIDVHYIIIRQLVCQLYVYIHFPNGTKTCISRQILFQTDFMLYIFTVFRAKVPSSKYTMQIQCVFWASSLMRIYIYITFAYTKESNVSGLSLWWI